MVPLSLKTIFARWVDAMDRRDQGSAWVVTTAALAPTAQGVGTRQVNIAAGLYVANAGAFVNFAGGNKTPAAAAANPHVDLIYIDIAGVLQLAAGAEAVTNPVPPALPAGACPIALVYIAPGAVDYTASNLAYIFDVRVFYAPTFLPDGTIGAPSLPFGNEKTVGLYRVGAAVMGVAGSLAIGTTPAASGVLRIPNALNISGRNNANNADIPMAQVNASDELRLRNDDARVGVGYISISSSAAVSGVLRVPNNQQIKGRNNANNADIGMIYTRTDDTVGIPVVLTVEGASVLIGTTPAAAGVLRIPNNTVERARNAANSADIDLLSLNGSNKVVLGGQAPGSDGQVLTADAATTGGFKWATGAASTTDVQTFTGNGTWTKPGGTPRMVMVIAFGAGGGGGGGKGDIATANRQGGGAGGGGAFVIRWFDPSALGATETITIGAAGGGGAGGSSTTGTSGTAGGNTSFGAGPHFVAFGGGFGAGAGVGNHAGAGGGGGGSIGAGGNGTTAGVGGAGGAPNYGVASIGYHGGDGGAEANVGFVAEFAGAGGGGGSQVGSNGAAGGSSINGGPAGGGGGGVDSDTTTRAGGAGGTIQSYSTGGGGAGGAGGGTNPGTAGTSRSLTGKCGSGGGGGGGSNVGTGGAGGAGGVPSGGGGGGAGGTTVGGAGAGGARGEMLVFTFF